MYFIRASEYILKPWARSTGIVYLHTRVNGWYISNTIRAQVWIPVDPHSLLFADKEGLNYKKHIILCQWDSSETISTYFVWYHSDINCLKFGVIHGIKSLWEIQNTTIAWFIFHWVYQFIYQRQKSHICRPLFSNSKLVTKQHYFLNSWKYYLICMTLPKAFDRIHKNDTGM